MATGEILWPSSGTTRSFEVAAQPQTYLVAPSAFGTLGALLKGQDVVALADDSSGCKGDALDRDTALRISAGQWLSAVEPSTSIGHLPPSLLAVALKSGGTGIAGLLSEAGGRLTTTTAGEQGTYTVGGTVSGLPAPYAVHLQNNGGDDLLSASGAFTFATRLANGARYDVTVARVVADGVILSYRCSVANGAGTVASGDVTNVEVRCEPDSSNDGARSAFAAQPSPSPTEPSARTSYAGVFSREAGGVFVVGGRGFDGEPLSDVWFMPLDGPWQSVATGDVVLGRVLAATYAFGDGRLWVVDEIAEPGKNGPTRRRVRLLRVAPSGGAEVALSAPRGPGGRAFFLSVDHDGAPLLAIARENKFSLYRVGPRPGEPILRHLDERSGTLARPPIVDPNGYSFVLEGDGGGLRLDRVDDPPSRRRAAPPGAGPRVDDNDGFARLLQ